jgi:MATE family multidrug resistance protein
MLLYLPSKQQKLNLSTYTKEFSYNLRLAYPIIAGCLVIPLFVDNVMVGKWDQRCGRFS